MCHSSTGVLSLVVFFFFKYMVLCASWTMSKWWCRDCASPLCHLCMGLPFWKNAPLQSFLSPHEGGLGLVNLEIKLKVQKFLLLRNKQNNVLATAPRTLGGCYLAALQVGASDISKKAPVLRYYKEITEAVKYFEDQFFWEYVARVQRKRLCWDTTDLSIPPPVYRAVFPQVKSSDVFKRLRYYAVRTSPNDLCVRFHGVPSGQKLGNNQGIFFPSGMNCVLYPTEETLKYTFIYCSNAELFWGHIWFVFKVDLYPTW